MPCARPQSATPVLFVSEFIRWLAADTSPSVAKRTTPVSTSRAAHALKCHRTRC